MHNLVGNIKNRNMGYLEQVCERYAAMAYEVLRRELAMGFKSITYSYYGDENDRFFGTFTATLIPFEQTDKYRHGHRSTLIRFDIQADQEEDCWYLSNGRITDVQSSMEAKIAFTRGSIKRIAIYITDWDEVRFASNADHGGDEVFQISSGKKPWADVHTSITI